MNQNNMTKNFCFTANHQIPYLGVAEQYPPTDIQQKLNVVQQWGKKECKIQYVCIGKEGLQPGKTEHWQGFLQTTERCRWTALKKLLPDDWVWHWENKRRNSTCDQARDYCLKEGNETHEWGAFLGSAGQGKRTDLEQVADLATEGKRPEEIAELHPVQWIKFHKGIESLCSMIVLNNLPQKRDVKTFICHGRTRSGKTHACYFTCLEGRKVYKIQGDNLKNRWFDGYRGEEILFIDELTPGDCKLSLLLQLFEGYQNRIPKKGGFLYGQWEEVRVTTNLHWPTKWYTGVPQVRREALFARIAGVYEMNKPWREQTPPIFEGEVGDQPPPKAGGAYAEFPQSNWGFVFEEDFEPPVKQMATQPPIDYQEGGEDDERWED